ncbi:putative L,D-transpeptidase YnhG [bacterium HR12]|nr:putative L,D-transpeptidase YnhG [bacterium HR12]
MATGKHGRRSHRGLKGAAIVLAALALLGGGSAYAAYRYDTAASVRILPGIRIAGLDVSGMTRAEALREVAALASRTLDAPLSVRAGDRTWTVTRAALGMTADVEGAVDEAFALADGMSFVSRVYHRLADRPVEATLELPFRIDEGAIRRFVERARDEVAVPAVNARIALVEGELVTRRARPGITLGVRAAVERIRRALEERSSAVSIPLRTVEPEVTAADLGKTIVVDLSENVLWLYDGLKIVKEYPVATAAPGYVTPVGTWRVIDKKENPTWYNPALDSWGADLPPVIAPGPNNPLGTRALYLNAPGIRIHGTADAASIGTYASHGCIRMYISDSEELYPLVPIGTRVIIKP